MQTHHRQPYKYHHLSHLLLPHGLQLVIWSYLAYGLWHLLLTLVWWNAKNVANQFYGAFWSITLVGSYSALTYFTSHFLAENCALIRSGGKKGIKGKLEAEGDPWTVLPQVLLKYQALRSKKRPEKAKSVPIPRRTREEKEQTDRESYERSLERPSGLR